MDDDLHNLRKKLKAWETNFYNENGRKPKKDDIESASTEIRDTYAQYSTLKKSAQKGSLASNDDFSNGERNKTIEDGTGIKQLSGKHEEDKLLDNALEQGDNQVDVWSRKFDKKTPGNNTSALHKEQKDNASCNMFLQNLGSKLFENSKMTKNSVRSGVSTSWKKSTSASEVKIASPEQTVHDEAVFRDETGDSQNSDQIGSVSGVKKRFNLNKPKFGTFAKAASLASPKIRHPLSDDSSISLPGRFSTTPKQRNKIPTLPGSTYTWDEKEEPNKGDNSHTDWDEVDSMTFSPVSKKSRTKAVSKVMDEEEWIPDEADLEKIDMKYCKQTKAGDSSSKDEISNTTAVEKITSKQTSADEGLTSVEMPSAAVKKLRKPVKQRPDSNSLEGNSQTEEDKNLQISKTEKETTSAKIDMSKVGNPRSQFDFMEEDIEVPIIPKQNKKRKAQDEEKDESNKRRKKEKCQKKPKAMPDDVVLATGSDDEKSSSVHKAGPVSRKKAAGASNENFVRLNMKVKSYRRKGKGMTGPQMRRFQWKQKMKARSASYGDKCFKCGQEGHWANKCKVKTSSGLDEEGGGGSQPVLEEDFPSLHEAAMMARGVKINKPAKVRSEVKDIQTSITTADDDMDFAVLQGSDTEDAEEIQIEADIVRTSPEEVAAPPPMSPLHQADNHVTDTPGYVMDGLKKFGYSQFRQGQQNAIMRILSGLSTLVVLSTGGGKSLCYQLPAYLYAQRSKAVTLVISPLVSLMEDQITGLPPGIQGACLHTNMTPAQRERVLSSVKEGKVHFLLISPEAIAGGSMSLLNARESLPPIAFVCIDEAHCLSEWSHNFRPSYLRLCKVLREKFGVQCFLGLTATATQSTASDVAKHLGITDLERAVIRGIPVPANLNLSVSRDEDRDGALLGMLQGKRFSECESIIIYCTRRQQTDRLATLIRTCLKEEKNDDWEDKKEKKGRKKSYGFWDAESYHAGLTAAQRKRVQNAFMSGRLRVVVATVAFGMGLDKADVRGVIHYNMPKSFESYVQEIGRAGRDGKPSHCHLFLDAEVVLRIACTFIQKYATACKKGKDLNELRRHTYANTVDYRTLKKFVRKVFLPCHCKAVQKLHQQAVQDKDEAADKGNEATSNAADDKITVLTEEQQNQVPENACKKRICPGHERTMCIEDTVMDLDVKEEGISTLMCYLELQGQFIVQNLSNVYATCQLQCYGGPSQLQAVAKKCPPVAVAIAKAKKDGKSFANANNISFQVVEISDCMGWNSGLVKRELKLLPWDMNRPGSTGPTKTGVLVEFTDLAFHFRSPGDLDDDEMDDVLQFLHNRIQCQEKSEVQQLNYLYQTLKKVSHKNYWMCSDDLDQRRNEQLRSDLRDYFQNQELVLQTTEMPQISTSTQDLNQAVADIHQFVSVYGQDHHVNGRSLARIFHGIGSPCYPASTWGRVRRFWRSHMHIDFNELVKIATKEIIKMR